MAVIFKIHKTRSFQALFLHDYGAQKLEEQSDSSGRSNDG